MDNYIVPERSGGRCLVLNKSVHSSQEKLSSTRPNYLWYESRVLHHMLSLVITSDKSMWRRSLKCMTCSRKGKRRRGTREGSQTDKRVFFCLLVLWKQTEEYNMQQKSKTSFTNISVIFHASVVLCVMFAYLQVPSLGCCNCTLGDWYFVALSRITSLYTSVTSVALL